MNASEHESSDQNKKSGPKVAQSSGRGRLSKTHPDYWKPRLVKRAGGSDFSVRVQHAGRREWFNTHSANAVNACDKARKIYLDVVAIGWDGALEKHKPKPKTAAKVATVGEVIAIASRAANIRPITLNAYASALRRLAAGVAGLHAPTGTSRFAYMRPEFGEFRARVDALPVDSLTAAAFAEWRKRIVDSKATPPERKSAEISCDTVARCAAALFSDKLLASLKAEITLPSPLPLKGVRYGRSTRRHKAKINALWLFEQAKAELEAQRPEQYKAFLLCFLAGLRRREADTLTWRQIDLNTGEISIERTDFFEPKTEESDRNPTLPRAAVDALRSLKGAASDADFVLFGGEAKPNARYRYYRADLAPRRGLPALRTWSSLIQWLASKGVSERNAIHVLRKHAGSLIYRKYGLEAARKFLGHSDISTTSGSYVDAGNPTIDHDVLAADDTPVNHVDRNGGGL